MKLSIIAFSETGYALGQRIQTRFSGAQLTRCEDGGLSEWTETRFESDGLVFIGACGIAVRAIAPLVQSKLRDPAVVVCDETGRFAVSLLSGHAGGANLLAEQVARCIGALPVITTASDCHAILNGTEPQCNLVLGIGCRRGLSAETIERAVTTSLWRFKIPLNRICRAATIDIKADEEGLLRFAKVHSIPFYFYTAEELASVPGDFTASERVYEAVGVDNVCERAAVLCGNDGKLILRKTVKDGVTIAVFERRDSDG